MVQTTPMTTYKTLSDMIDSIWLNELNTILTQKCNYSAFILIGCGIEFLGKCLQIPNGRSSWFNGEPGKDFKKALSLPSLTKYDAEDLYEKLRCGMVHSSFPKQGITLTDTANQNLTGSDKVYDINELYCDFIDACNEVKKRLNGNASNQSDNLNTYPLATGNALVILDYGAYTTSGCCIP
jgi:hypothetical protein